MKISINQNLKITSEDIILYLQKSFIFFDKNKLVIEKWINNYFDIKLAYSYDKINWSNPTLIDEFINPSNDEDSLENNNIQQSVDKEIYIAIYLVRKILENQEANTLYVTKNTEDTQQEYVLKGIGYKNKYGVVWYNLDDPCHIKYKLIDNITYRYPKWNLYDNQQESIRRWKDQMNSLTEMYGHVVIYFRTEPIETIHTFANHVLKGIVDIKKIKIMVPNNELPQDRQTFTDWDIMLQDDFMIHVVTEVFEQAFGKNKIPNENDIIYFPLIRKLYKVSSMQPRNGFMGIIGWWETFLAKYEENECIVMSDELKKSLKKDNDLFNIPVSEEIQDGLDILETIPKSQNLDKVLSELETIKDNTIYDSEVIDEKSIEEKKEVTQNFTNKLEDSTAYISVKETDYQRDIYNKRLKIVEVNPDETSYPIMMYDATTVEKRILAMSYDLKELTSKNKFKLIPLNTLNFSFDYVLLNRFDGEIFDIIYDDILPIITLEQSKRKIIIKNNNESFEINYNFDLKEFYKIEIEFNLKLKQLAIQIYKLVDKQKYLEYQDLYIFKDIIIPQISNVFLYGGNFYVSNIELKIDNNKIMEDFANPVLQMNKNNLG